MTLASIVDWEGILDVVAVSFVAGVGVTAVYALAVLGITRVADANRDGRARAAAAYGALAIVAFAAVVAACIAGIVVLTH